MSFNDALAHRRTVLEARAAIMNHLRQFFVKGGFLEVETPLRIPAPAPEFFIDAIPADGWFLHTSPELCMKRMLAAGFEKIFQICRCWRSGERGSLHLTEFTMLEWYRSGSGYELLMSDCEDLVQTLAERVGLGQSIDFRGMHVNLSRQWERISVREAFRRYGGLSMEEAIARDCFDEVMVEAIEPALFLDRPVFLYEYPAERSALARLKENDPTVSERFELYIGGVEIANAFAELTDAEEQRKRFLLESIARKSAGKPDYPLPERFLDELPGMPASAGIALGLDRLIMVLLNKQNIDDVVAFLPEEL